MTDNYIQSFFYQI